MSIWLEAVTLGGPIFLRRGLEALLSLVEEGKEQSDEPPKALREFCTPCYDSYSFTLHNVRETLVLAPSKEFTLQEIYEFAIQRKGQFLYRRPVAVSVENLPPEFTRLLELSGQTDFIKNNVDEVVFAPVAGSFVGNQKAITDDKVRPGRKLVFIGLTECDGTLQDPVDLFFALIHETRHRATFINIASGQEPKKNREDTCLYEQLAKRKELEVANQLLLRKDALSPHEIKLIMKWRTGSESGIKDWEECVD